MAEAEDGRQAVQLAAETKPDVAILDYQLPSMNGVDATREIRAFQPQTEVLIFTMHESEPLVRELLEAGAYGLSGRRCHGPGSSTSSGPAGSSGRSASSATGLPPTKRAQARRLCTRPSASR